MAAHRRSRRRGPGQRLDLEVLVEPGEAVLAADFYGLAVNNAVFHQEYGGLFAGSKECARGNADYVLCFVDHDAGFDAEPVAKRRALLGRLDDVGDDPDALFFNSKGRDFGEAGRLEALVCKFLYQRFQRHPVLQGHAGEGADAVHQTTDGRTFLGHRDE